ncbi:unnamed protein product [Prunus armeniaca]
MVYIKVGSLKVFYKVHAEDVVKEILDDRCIANLVGTIPSNRVVVLYFHDPTDQNTLDSKKEEVWPSLDSDEYANVAKEEHVQVEFDGNEADNEEENVEVESAGSESENEEENVEVEYGGSESENEEENVEVEYGGSEYEFNNHIKDPKIYFISRLHLDETPDYLRTHFLKGSSHI